MEPSAIYEAAVDAVEYVAVKQDLDFIGWSADEAAKVAAACALLAAALAAKAHDAIVS